MSVCSTLSLSPTHRHTQLHPLSRTSVALQVCNQQGLETSTWILFTPVFSCKSSTLLVNKNSRRTHIRKPSVMCTSTTFRRHLQVSHNSVSLTRCKRKLVSCQQLVSNIAIFIENMFGTLHCFLPVCGQVLYQLSSLS